MGLRRGQSSDCWTEMREVLDGGGNLGHRVKNRENWPEAARAWSGPRHYQIKMLRGTLIVSSRDISRGEVILRRQVRDVHVERRPAKLGSCCK
jgi:hypothetical protein